MMMHILQRPLSALALSLAIGALALAPAAHAQSQHLQYGAPQDQYTGPQPRSFHRDRGSNENRVERRMEALHQRFGITPAQETAWTAFVSEMRHTAEMRQHAPAAREHGDQMNIVDRLEQRARMLEMRSANTERLARALRTLYDSFSEDQKQIATSCCSALKMNVRASRPVAATAGLPPPKPRHAIARGLSIMLTRCAAHEAAHLDFAPDFAAATAGTESR